MAIHMLQLVVGFVVVAWPHLQPQTMIFIVFIFCLYTNFLLFNDATCLQVLVLKLGNEIFHHPFMYGVA
jgi:hypothetical protein